LEHFSKTYSTTVAVTDVTLEAFPGEVTGLIGENGAGKTTILKAIGGVHFPSSGTVTVGGGEGAPGVDAAAEPEQLRRLVGYVPEQGLFYEGFTAREHLYFLATSLGVPPERCKEVAELCGVTREMLDKKCGALSRGYQQRLALAAALLSDPPVLVLDEPTAALDPVQAHSMRRLIAHLGEEKTVLLSTHNLNEAEALCLRLHVLHRGRLLFSGTQPELRQCTGGATVEEAFFSLVGAYSIEQ
jgi:ABC-2 type transport system ATP-binding protein